MLRQTLSLAARNLTRHRRRTLVTAAGMCLGVTAALVLQGFVVGLLGLIGGVMVQGRLGAVQVHKVGHLQADQEALQFTLPLDPALMAQIEAVPGVVAVAPRLSFEATIGNGSQSTLALVTAIDSVREAKVCPQRFRNVLGAAIGRDDLAVAVLGIKLAAGLRAENGENLQLLAQGQGGQPNVVDIKVLGRAPAAVEMDARRLVMTTLPHAQALLQMPNMVSEYAIGIARTDQADAVARQLQHVLGPKYQVVSWLDLLPQLRSILGLLSSVMAIVVGVLLSLMVTAVANTMVMSVHERTREIGTMMALGARRHWLMRLLLAEACLLGVLGTATGAVLGTLLVAQLHAHGVTFTPPGADVPSTLVPSVDVWAVLLTTAVALTGAVTAGVGPAWRASKLTPTECLRMT